MVKARVVYTMKHIRATMRLKSLLLYIFFIVCTLYMLGSCFVLAAGLPLLCLISATALPDGYAFYLFVSLLLTFGVLYVDFFVFILAPKRNFEKHRRKYGDMPISFEFSESGMKVEAQTVGYEEHLSFAYDKFDIAVETKNFFVISENSVTAYIIGKHEITEGNAEQLRALLRNNMGNKFKIKG